MTEDSGLIQVFVAEELLGTIPGTLVREDGEKDADYQRRIRVWETLFGLGQAQAAARARDGAPDNRAPGAGAGQTDT
jgi:hypothetical protein